jgi:hypothetical protein
MATLEDIEKEFVIVKSQYASLSDLREFEKWFCISGDLPIIDSNGWNWGVYKIKIVIFKTYPHDLPILIETGGAIERHINWHISKDGICCVGTSARQYRDMADGISISKWIRLFVIPYLANHAYKKEKAEYVDGELEHRAEGLFQDYASCFNINEPEQVILHIEYILGIRKMSLNGYCFCDSGKKYKRCFLINPKVHTLGIPNKVFQQDLKSLKSHYLVS